MGRPMTDLPIVQFKKLTPDQRLEIVERVFTLVEYDEDENPGADRDSGDIAQCLYDTFDEFGVRFSDSSQMPAGYRFNHHQRPGGVWCRWSHGSVVEPMKRTVKGNLLCPDDCPASTVENDPNVTAEMIDIDGLHVHLKALGVPFTMVNDSGGVWLLLVGNGEWDETAGRYTHPITAGPCYQARDAYVAPQIEFSYGRNTADGSTDGRDFYDHDEDPEALARGIASLLSETTPAS